MAASADAVTVTVKNAGAMAAETVVELYVKPLESKDAAPHPSLAGFGRVALQPGEAKRVTVPFAPTAFTVVNDEGERVSGGKKYRVFAGFSQPDARSEELTGMKPLAMEIER